MAVAASDLDAFAEKLHIAIPPYANALPAVGSAVSVPAAPLTINVATTSVSPLSPIAGVANAVGSPVAATSSRPSRLTRSIAPAVFNRETAPRAVEGVSIATQYHLPIQAVLGSRENQSFPTYPTAAVIADDEGRAVELADATPAVTHAFPRAVVRAKPRVLAASSAAVAVASVPLVGAASSDVATIPTPVAAALTPVSGTPIMTVSRGRGDLPTLEGAGVSNPSGWVPNPGVQADGVSRAAPGDLAWETTVNDNGGDPGGVRGATTAGWSSGTDIASAPSSLGWETEVATGRFHLGGDAPFGTTYGTSTVVPEPTSLLGVALTTAFLRRRR